MMLLLLLEHKISLGVIQLGQFMFMFVVIHKFKYWGLFSWK